MGAMAYFCMMGNAGLISSTVVGVSACRVLGLGITGVLC